jgi:putative CocE/NonD family hydrolase
MTIGGSTCCSEDVTPVSMGPRDQQQAEWRPDVLVYTSDPLEEDVEVTGPVSVVLYASSSASDTDFTAKLVDVHPGGKSINVAQGIIRARYRDSWEKPELLTPGEVYKFTIDLWSTSNCFVAGHRIGVEISSSNFPQFDRNPNTGHPFGKDSETQIATQTIYHDEERPSHVLLPVIPEGV